MLTPAGGTFVIALILYVFYKRRRGKTYAQILRVPPRRPETPQLTPTSMREKFWKHPIYHEVDYSVRSSRISSTTTIPPRARLGSRAASGRPKHQRIKSVWKDPDLPATPSTSGPKTPGLPTNNSTFLFEKSPELKPRTPEKAHTSAQSKSLHNRESSLSKECSTIIEAETSLDGESDGDDFQSALASPPMLTDGVDRWSWTNSQAPSTPRLLPKTRRASLASTKYSAPRFKSVRSWALGQGERLRIDEDAPPLLPAPDLLPAFSGKRALKDKYGSEFSHKSSKKNSKTKGHVKGTPSRGNLASFFKSSPSNQATPRDLENGPMGAGIEMSER